MQLDDLMTDAFTIGGTVRFYKLLTLNKKVGKPKGSRSECTQHDGRSDITHTEWEEGTMDDAGICRISERAAQV